MRRESVLVLAILICSIFIMIRVKGHNPSYEIVAVHGSTPIIDGVINIHEWSDATSISFNITEVFVKQDGTNLYIGFKNSEPQFHDDDAINILVDVDHDGSLTLQSDDIGLGVYRNGTLIEANVTGGTWTITKVSGWTAVVNSTSDMWQVEINIPYSKINIVAGVEKTIGVAFVCWRGLEGSSPNVFSWPPRYTETYTNPSKWGAITSNGYNWTSYPPRILFLSPENKTYDISDISLTFTVDESVSWMAYSLDGQSNVTTTGNTTLSGLSDGSHSLIVYANDTAGNIEASEMVYFSIETPPEPFPTEIVAVIVIVAVAIVALAGAVYFWKKRRDRR